MDESNLIVTALSEIGYCTPNYNNKYGEYLDTIGFYPEKVNGTAWCGTFVDWCFVKTFGAETAKTILYRDKAVNAYEAYKAAGKLDDSPEVGSQIFFYNKEGKISHTGIVTKTEDYGDDIITYISGNNIADGRQVMLRRIDRSNKRVAGYGKPNYEAIKIFEGEDDVTPEIPIVPLYDLTNTKWQLNESVDTGEVDGQTFYVDGRTDDGLEFTCIKFEGGFIYYGSELVYDGSWVDNGTVVQDPNRRTITITGGSDVTNATLGAWLTANGVQATIEYPKINQFLFFGKPLRYINGKKIRYVHYGENTYQMVYADEEPLGVVEAHVENTTLVFTSGAKVSGTTLMLGEGATVEGTTLVVKNTGGGKVTDLTNTTWKFEGTGEWVPQIWGTNEYSIDYIIVGTDETGTSVSLDSDHTYLAFGMGGFWSTTDKIYGLGGGNTLTITGGTDATNQTLIDWLYANATLQT